MLAETFSSQQWIVTMLKAYVQMDNFDPNLYTVLECYQVQSKVPAHTNKHSESHKS